MPFAITCFWSERPQPYSVPEDLHLRPPLYQAMLRFFARHTGRFQVPLEGGELTFSLEYDFVASYEQLPEWLTRLATRCEEAALLFGTQGTELELVAERRSGTIALFARNLMPERRMPPALRPLMLPAAEFLSAWVQFVQTILDALEQAEPQLMREPEAIEYRAAIAAAERVQPCG